MYTTSYTYEYTCMFIYTQYHGHKLTHGLINKVVWHQFVLCLLCSGVQQWSDIKVNVLISHPRGQQCGGGRNEYQNANLSFALSRIACLQGQKFPLENRQLKLRRGGGREWISGRQCEQWVGGEKKCGGGNRCNICLYNYQLSMSQSKKKFYCKPNRKCLLKQLLLLLWILLLLGSDSTLIQCPIHYNQRQPNFFFLTF